MPQVLNKQPGRLLLASASPRRLALLRAAGIEPEVRAADVQELTGGLPPDQLAQANAELKARAVAEQAGPELAGNTAVVAADTVVALSGLIFGKPADAGEARQMLAQLSGREHSVFTGVAVWRQGQLQSGVAESRLRFRELSQEEIAAYVAGGEPLDKAGAYAVQGGAAAFVQHISGDLDNIVGLPLALLAKMLPLAEYKTAGGQN